MKYFTFNLLRLGIGQHLYFVAILRGFIILAKHIPILTRVHRRGI